MKLLFSALFLFLLICTSCSTDVFVPCDCDNCDINLPCKQYIYEGKIIGYYDFEYDMEGRLTTKTLYNQSGNKVETEYRSYDGGNLVEKINGNFTMQYLYDKNNYLHTEIYSEKDIILNKTIYSYNASQLPDSVFEYADDTLSSYRVYQYYPDDSLYKITYYVADNSIDAYKLFYYYDNFMKRINEYDSKGNLLGYTTYTSDSQGNILEEHFFEADKSLNSFEIFEYADFLLQKHYYYDSLSVLVRHEEYLYWK